MVKTWLVLVLWTAEIRKIVNHFQCLIETTDIPARTGHLHIFLSEGCLNEVSHMAVVSRQTGWPLRDESVVN